MFESVIEEKVSKMTRTIENGHGMPKVHGFEDLVFSLGFDISLEWFFLQNLKNNPFLSIPCRL